MSRSIVPLLLTVSLAALACTGPDTITNAGTADLPAIAAVRGTAAASYTVQEVGFLPGDVQSDATGVNDLGYVVGVSLPPFSQEPWRQHAFLRIGTTMTTLSLDGIANAVSSGSPLYIAGSDQSVGNDRPVRWTRDPATGSISEEVIDVVGTAVDINDAGTMIGTASGVATVWPVGGTPVTIPPSAGFTRSTGRGINNAGHAGVTFHGATSRAHLVVNGTLIELTPAPGHTLSFGGEVSEPVDGFVYVSGISAGNVENDYHLARWKVDVANGVLVSVEARAEVSEGRGVGDDGTVPGQIEGRGPSSTIAWTLSGTIALKPTKGASNPEAQDISANSRYVVGSAIYKGFNSRGLLWTRTP